MSKVKSYLNWVSVQMGLNGKITEEVRKAADREQTLQEYQRRQRELRRLSYQELNVPIVDK